MTFLLASEFDILFPAIKSSSLFVDRRKLSFIPTASVYKEKDILAYFDAMVARPFLALGIDAEYVDICHFSQTEVRKHFKNSDIVYVGGGNTFYLLEKMKSCRFGDELHDFINRNGLYIGSSAGSVIACPDISFISPMDDPAIAKLNDTAGLGLIDRALIPHMDHNHHADAAKIIFDQLSRSGKVFFALKDTQALLVQDKQITLVDSTAPDSWPV